MTKSNGKKGGKGALSARQVKLVEILATPEGSQLTQKQIADKIGASHKSVHRWMKEKAVQEAVQAKINQHAYKLLPHAWKCLEERMHKDSQALKLYFSLIGEHADKLQLSGENGGSIKISTLSTLSEEDLTQLQAQLKE